MNSSPEQNQNNTAVPQDINIDTNTERSPFRHNIEEDNIDSKDQKSGSFYSDNSDNETYSRDEEYGYRRPEISFEEFAARLAEQRRTVSDMARQERERDTRIRKEQLEAKRKAEDDAREQRIDERRKDMDQRLTEKRWQMNNDMLERAQQRVTTSKMLEEHKTAEIIRREEAKQKTRQTALITYTITESKNVARICDMLGFCVFMGGVVLVAWKALEVSRH